MLQQPFRVNVPANITFAGGDVVNMRTQATQSKLDKKMAKANQKIAVNTSSVFNCYMNRKENSCLHREHKLRNYKEKSKHAVIHDQNLHGDLHPLETLVADQNRSCQPDCSRNPMEKQRTKKEG